MKTRLLNTTHITETQTFGRTLVNTLALAAGVLMVWDVAVCQAATRRYDGGGGANRWTDRTNWDPNFASSANPKYPNNNTFRVDFDAASGGDTYVHLNGEDITIGQIRVLNPTTITRVENKSDDANFLYLDPVSFSDVGLNMSEALKDFGFRANGSDSSKDFRVYLQRDQTWNVDGDGDLTFSQSHATGNDVILGLLTNTLTLNVGAGREVVFDEGKVWCRTGGGITKTGPGLLDFNNTQQAGMFGLGIDGGEVRLRGSTTLYDAVDVEIASGATMDIATGNTHDVNSLTLGGAPKVKGTWGAAGSGAQFTSDYFKGNGKLNVLAGPAGGSVFVIK